VTVDQIVNDWMGSRNCPNQNKFPCVDAGCRRTCLEQRIAQAIKDAVEEAHNIDVASGLKQIDFYVAEERESCAKVADGLYDKGPSINNRSWSQSWGSGVLDVAAAIRSRK